MMKHTIDRKYFESHRLEIIIKFKVQQYSAYCESSHRKSLDLSNEIHHFISNLYQEIEDLNTEITERKRRLLDENFYCL